MSARILIVDDLPVNRMLLQAILEDEYFEVLVASGGAEATEIAARERPDLILMDVMMPNEDGFSVTQRLKAAPETHAIPVMLVTARADPDARVDGLSAGAEDFVTKPIRGPELIARVRALLQHKRIADELSIPSREGELVAAPDSGGDRLSRDLTIALIDNLAAPLTQLRAQLATFGEIRTLPLPTALETLRKSNFDLIALPIGAQDSDGLRLLSRLRGHAETRDLPILAASLDDHSEPLVRAFEIGASDCLHLPAHQAEVQTRVRALLRRKRETDRLRSNVHRNMQLAITDEVTGLYNRHYLSQHLNLMIEAARDDDRPLSVALFDLDRFKAVNDQHGHHAGDRILRKVAELIATNIRGVDIAARYGGEEFAVIMPGVDLFGAELVAERIRHVVAAGGPPPSGMENIDITTSGGVAMLAMNDDASALLARADNALYAAKRAGRNCVRRDEDSDRDMAITS
ncbi:MAG: diguanylate cyclase [Pacificimonas sp.]